MPLVRGILMSVTMTSNSAVSILRLASSPETTVSTLCPSLRRAMSSTSQIERSSSHTRMLPMGPPSHHRRQRRLDLRAGVTAAQPYHELRAVAFRRAHGDLALV